MRPDVTIDNSQRTTASITLLVLLTIGAPLLEVQPVIADEPTAPLTGSDNDNAFAWPVETDRSASGIWRTDRGPMTLFVVYPEGYGRASYAWFNGSLIGSVEKDGVFIGSWRQDNGEMLCESSGGLREFRGRVIFWPDGEDRFVGEVMFCDDLQEERGARWDGVLIAGEAWFNPDIWYGHETRRPELDMSVQQAYTLMQQTFGDAFDPERAQSNVFDMTCDGGRDYVFVWQGPADDPRFRLSAAHYERPIYDGEDTASVETITLGGSDLEQPGRCPIARADEMAVKELDPLLRGAIGAPTLAPTCSQIVVGPGPLCRVYWDLETGKFDFY